MTINYDQAAGSYSAHRQIHHGVFSALLERGGLFPSTRVLEIGCGTGNYVQAVAQRQGWGAYGLDPSAAMLARAQATGGGPAHLILGRAEQIAFPANSFDLIFSVDVIHHVEDRAAFYSGVARTLRAGGLVCTVTDSADIIRRRELLSGYFPETVEVEMARYPRISQLEAWMAAAGLADIEVETVQEAYEVTGSQPFRDKAYSSLHLISDEAFRAGLERLERDLTRGPLRGVSRYACVWGRKG